MKLTARHLTLFIPFALLLIGLAWPVYAQQGPPDIPHPLEGRDQCLACHQTGAAGAPKIPDNHAGRTEDMCLNCHTQATVPEIPHILEGRENCLDCHSAQSGETVPLGEVVRDWQISIHAKRGVICADCHGGDPNAADQDESMSEAAGYIGKPDREDIPELCGACHSDVNQMRQFDLPTDQLAKYRESFHGQQLANGNTKVATCYDCHGGHAIREVNDPQAAVYQLNVPAMCAACHADEDYMAEYDIPTNQYDLYRSSVHGLALLDNQDTRSPSCATCHGTHGAAPPGFGEVANVCGSCHSATQDYYLQSPHSSDNPDAPDCVACHGRYDVQVPGEYMFEGEEDRRCGSCHAPDSEVAAVVGEMRTELVNAARAFDEAEAAVEQATDRGMLMSEEERLLADARTRLITARAAQHTASLDTLKQETQVSLELSQQVKDSAEQAVRELRFRQQAMIVVLVVIPNRLASGARGTFVQMRISLAS